MITPTPSTPTPSTHHDTQEGHPTVRELAVQFETALNQSVGLETIAGELHRHGLYSLLFALIDVAKNPISAVSVADVQEGE